MKASDILEILDGVPTANLDLIGLSQEAARADGSIDPRRFDRDPERTRLAVAEARQYIRATDALKENLTWTFDRR